MTIKLQAVRGMHDLMPDTCAEWQVVENTIRNVMYGFAYQEIRFPIVESTALFARTLGDTTDIVEKEMYTFADRNGDSLTLRPEGTAGCVRAGIQSGILHNQIQRLWYAGPMFRHERPQKGRTRQFHQVGAEFFGVREPQADAELIHLAASLFSRLGILHKLRLEINTLGILEERHAYKQALVTYFKQHWEQLDEDSQRRLNTNPLRILDTKNPALKSIVDSAPCLWDYLGDASRAHFDTLKALLETLKIDYQVNFRLVRGLDYYAHTVFEWITDDLGAQGTVCGGGRYDGLVDILGGQSNGAVGFALGMERLVELCEIKASVLPHICIIPLTPACMGRALQLAQLAREAVPELCVITLLTEGSAKSLFKRADKTGAEFALILGEEEILQGTVTMKALRDMIEQSSWPVDQSLWEFLAQQCLRTV